MENQDEKQISPLISAAIRRNLDLLISAYEEIKKIEDTREQEEKLNLFSANLDNYLVAMQEFRRQILNTKSTLPDMFWNNIWELIEGEDIQAIKNLIKTWFPRKALFFTSGRVNEFENLRASLYARLGENRDSPTAMREEWEQIVASNLFLAFDKMELEKLRPKNNPASRMESVKDEKRSDAYHDLILHEKELIERDLLDGARIASKEHKKVINFEDLPDETKRTLNFQKMQQKEQELADLMSERDNSIDDLKAIQHIQKQLNKKEIQLCHEIATGYPNDEIANHLGITRLVLRKRRQRLFEKLRVLLE